MQVVETHGGYEAVGARLSSPQPYALAGPTPRLSASRNAWASMTLSSPSNCTGCTRTAAAPRPPVAARTDERTPPGRTTNPNCSPLRESHATRSSSPSNGTRGLCRRGAAPTAAEPTFFVGFATRRNRKVAPTAIHPQPSYVLDCVCQHVAFRERIPRGFNRRLNQDGRSPSSCELGLNAKQHAKVRARRWPVVLRKSAHQRRCNSVGSDRSRNTKGSRGCRRS